MKMYNIDCSYHFKPCFACVIECIEFETNLLTIFAFVTFLKIEDTEENLASNTKTYIRHICTNKLDKKIIYLPNV